MSRSRGSKAGERRRLAALKRCGRRQMEREALRWRVVGSGGVLCAAGGVLCGAHDSLVGWALVGERVRRVRAVVSAAERYEWALACSCERCANVIREAHGRSAWERTLARESRSTDRVGARARLGGGIVTGREARESDAAHAMPDTMLQVIAIRREGFGVGLTPGSGNPTTERGES